MTKGASVRAADNGGIPRKPISFAKLQTGHEQRETKTLERAAAPEASQRCLCVYGKMLIRRPEFEY